MKQCQEIGEARLQHQQYPAYIKYKLYSKVIFIFKVNVNIFRNNYQIC